jgi:hypothetical protein
MNNFFPFIHIKKKKKELEQLPLYQELPIFPLEQQEEKEEESIIIIELLTF